MDWTILKKVIDENDSFLITSHVRPDADALGSELGLRAILLALGKKVSIINASAPPANLSFMNPPGVILKLNDTVTKANVPKTDVVVIVDTSAWQQLGNMADVIQASPQEVKVFHIENSLPQTGVFPLDGNPLAGNPLALSDGFLAVRRDGMLIKLDATAATTLGSRSLGQLVQQGPLVINGQTLVVGYDGSLYQIDPSSL